MKEGVVGEARYVIIIISASSHDPTGSASQALPQVSTRVISPLPRNLGSSFRWHYAPFESP